MSRSQHRVSSLALLERIADPADVDCMPAILAAKHQNKEAVENTHHMITPAGSAQAGHPTLAHDQGGARLYT